MNLNWTAILVATLIPNVVGMIWYNPHVFGSMWQKESCAVPTDADRKLWPMFMVVSFIFSFMIALSMAHLTIHQMSLGSLMADLRSNQELMKAMSAAQIKVGDQVFDVMDKFRTFKHGAFHGVLFGIFFLVPIVSITAMHEKKSFKYVLLTAGYWIVNLAIMGGIICGWKQAV